MKNNLLQDAYVSTELIDKDVPTLLSAPQLIREIRRRPIQCSEAFDILKQGLIRSLNPNEWLQELVNTGQFALARRILPYTDMTARPDLRRLSRELERHCTDSIARVQIRLESQRSVIDQKALADLEESLIDANRLQEEWWFDLAFEKVSEIERMIDLYVADAIKERQSRFDQAQKLISSVRRDMLQAEPVVRQNRTAEIVWELLGYADRLSTSPNSDLISIEELCSAIRQLYQGASIDQITLEQFRTTYGQTQSQSKILSSSISETSRYDLESVVPAGITMPKLELETISPAARDLLNDLTGDETSLILFDLSQITLSSNSLWNEELATRAQSKLRALRVRAADSDETTWSNEVLQHSLYLVRYWGEKRKNVPEDVIADITTILSIYSDLRADTLLKAGRWDPACEYYRLSFRLRARRGYLIGLEPSSVLNYFSAYASRRPTPERYLRQAREQYNLSPAQLIAMGLQIGLECGEQGDSLWVVKSLIKLAAEDPALLEIVLESLDNIKDSKIHDWLKDSFGQMQQNQSKGGKSASLKQHLKLLLAEFAGYQQVLYENLRQLQNATKNTRTLRNVATVLQTLRDQEHIWADNIDLLLLNSLDKLSENLTSYFNAELSFQERDQIAQEILQHDIPFITSYITLSPTKIGIMYLSRAANNLQALLDEDVSQLRQVSLPAIEVNVEQSEWRADKYYYCHLSVQNTGNMRADGVNIRVEEAPFGEYLIPDDERERNAGTIVPSHSHNMHVHILPTPLEKHQDAFTLLVKIQYQVPQRSRRETRLIRLRVAGLATQHAKFEHIQNPYVVGGPVTNPKIFKGRKALVDALLVELANPERTGSVVIYGQKRSGKTSLFYHLSPPEFVIPILFDIPQILTSLPKISTDMQAKDREIAREEMLGRFLLALMERTIKDCENRGLEIRPMTWEELMAKPGPDFQFRQFLEQFRNSKFNHRLLFWFDEFTALIEKIDESVIDDSIMRLFKSLIENRYFSCVICGLTEVYEAVKRYANQLAVSQPRQVDYLDHEAARELIEDPIRLADKRSRFYSPQVVEEIIDLTAGSPFYIQLICQRLVEYMNQMEINHVTGADISEVIRKLIEGPERVDPTQQFDNLYLYKDDPKNDSRSSILEGLIVHLLAHETSNKPYSTVVALYKHIGHFVSEDEIDQILATLEQRQTIIQQTDDSTTPRRSRELRQTRQYRIRVDFFRRWLLANRPIDDAALRNFERKLKNDVAISKPISSD
jgi:hypothetical protein